jgi:hypothetical protein
MGSARFLKIILFTYFLLLVSISTEGQNYRHQLQCKGIRLPDIATVRQQIYDGAPAQYKTGIYKDMTYYHSALMANKVTDIIYQGDYYTDWPELEEYLYRIFKLIVPPDLANDTLFRIIISKNGYFNAFMTPTGLMSINVGLFDNLQDESTLAGIMAHELSHFMLNHSLRTYISYRTGKFDRLFAADEDLFNRYNSKLEYQADSMAVVLLNRSPYTLQGLIQAFDLMTLYDRNRNALSSSDIEFDETGHPSSENRKQRLLGYCNKLDINKGSKFVVNREFFYQTRQKAKQEILTSLLEQFSFDDCTEKAFKYHLLEPANHFYIRYLAESIRRNCYGQIEQWDKQFITYRYFDSLVNDKFRIPMKKSLFEKFNADILTMNQEEIDNMKAGFYWDGSKRFSTTEEAFNYFVKAGNRLKEPEIYFTNALSYTHDSLSRRSQLQKYLSCNNIAFPEYAHDLLNDSLEAVLPSKRLIVLGSADATIRVGKYDIELSSPSFDTSAIAKQLLDSLLVNKDSTIGIFLPDLKRTDLNKYRMLKSMMDFSFWTIVSHGEPLDIYLLEPEYWYIFKELGINKIEFVSCSFFKNEHYNKNPEQYWEVADTSVSDLLDQRGYSGYFNLALSQLSISKDQMPHTSYVENNIYLNKKEDSFRQIVNSIRFHKEKFDKINRTSMNRLKNK